MTITTLLVEVGYDAPVVTVHADEDTAVQALYDNYLVHEDGLPAARDEWVAWATEHAGYVIYIETHDLSEEAS